MLKQQDVLEQEILDTMLQDALFAAMIANTEAFLTSKLRRECLPSMSLILQNLRRLFTNDMSICEVCPGFKIAMKRSRMTLYIRYSWKKECFRATFDISYEANGSCSIQANPIRLCAAAVCQDIYVHPHSAREWDRMAIVRFIARKTTHEIIHDMTHSICLDQ